MPSVLGIYASEDSSNTYHTPAMSRRGPNLSLKQRGDSNYLKVENDGPRTNTQPQRTPQIRDRMISHLSPATSAIPSLDAGSSPSSHMTRSPVTPNKRTPYTPASFTSRLMTPMERYSPGYGAKDQKQIAMYRGEQFIHRWLQSSSRTSLSPDAHSISLVKSPKSHNGNILQKPAGLQRTNLFLLDAASVSQYGSPLNLFTEPSIGLNLDLRNSSPVQHVPSSRQSSRLINPFGDACLDGLLYIPEIDGDLNDERILRRNRLNPWPYDRKPLHYCIPHSLRSVGSLASRSRKASVFKSSPAFSRSLSLGLLRGRKFFSHRSKFEQDRFPNSQVPHPDWGSFPFTSADDDLDSDEEDNDVDIWLARVVRRNNRDARDALAVTQGCNRAMTVEEYERNGSWIFEHAWQEDLSAFRKARKENERSGKVTSPFQEHSGSLQAAVAVNPSRPRSPYLSRLPGFEAALVSDSLSRSASYSPVSASANVGLNSGRRMTTASSFLQKIGIKVRNTFKGPFERIGKFRRLETPSVVKKLPDTSPCDPASPLTPALVHSLRESLAPTSPFTIGSFGSSDSQLLPNTVTPSLTPGGTLSDVSCDDNFFSRSSLRVPQEQSVVIRNGDGPRNFGIGLDNE
ncbi:uncharacterized protein EI90DRAFT_2608993 [Cantharellus anzutake]|uniref:uncharacterized protein n=1 Tax=Cantharellus anzutake TaxID=1750568 RepID=UPI001902ED68|nr:uncharacterized protein EI90DRAFT_2608993 [Cantharellus anzutake]KAF8320631.1 hypothetical protein EI90DRAFT_2608993 [Cantharellus anzutake]